MSHVFISYSVKNSDYAYKLADKLREEGFDIWIDNSELRASDNWWESIVKALRSCAALIVIMTPESRSSKWVQKEVTLAERLDKRIFPILLAGSGDDWEIVVLTQYEDVTITPNSGKPPQYIGKLPPPIFYDTLAEFALRANKLGVNVTPSKAAINRRRIGSPTFLMMSSVLTVLFVLGLVALILISTSYGGDPTSGNMTRTAIVRQNATTAALLALTQTASLINSSVIIDPFTITPSNSTPTPISGITGEIAFATNRDGNYEIYVMNADGTNPIRLTNSPGEDRHPAWSPDGSKIAFVSDRDGNDEIYVMNADGSNQVRLTNDPGQDQFPAWSPDGKVIVYQSDRSGNDNIYEIALDGSNQHKLTDCSNGNDCVHPAWSPDGTQIGYTSISSDGIPQIYLMNADGSSPRNLTDNEAYHDENPVWSPDGKQIAYDTAGDGKKWIFIMGTDAGSSSRQITPVSSDQITITWSPNSTQLAFNTNQNGNEDIYVIGADGSNLYNITNNPADDTDPAWRPAPKT